MYHLLEKIICHEYLTEEEASGFIFGISNDEYPTEVISGILVGIQMRGIRLAEIQGFRSALLALSKPIDLESSKAIDLCGTGGDGKNTFNISTTTSFVLAEMGIPVIKHGNYGVSSLCGSSNVLEHLGVTFSDNSDELQRQLDKHSICFIHAPLFHPTMKKVASIRTNLATRTLFNCLGPLVNPAQPAYQMTGTFSLELAKIYQHILQTKRTDFVVTYGLDQYDEITLTDNTRIFSKHGDHILNAKKYGAYTVCPEDLSAGKSIADAAKIIQTTLSGKGTLAQNQVIAINTATALKMYYPETEMDDLYSESMSFISGGYAKKQLKQFS